ncbi:carbohydrate-binding protein [Streptomyces phaeoluteigriseus]|uniref:Carbohydrate-binding protein n=1 Tax=Streptomyces phaeoluteigriseus TaxID=114686 RepID=A0ABY4ZJ27_9ACTN|nr:carbohydrate-binding protein [Streptomyces phaeoluteigriseus]USQ89017.1 carbohydrate-binding protein [Streptomyces phaeoluteigriseus]
MTPGNNGASTPEDDDPFGYLYADGQANGAQPPSGGGYGYPSVNRVRPVGERQYGQQQTAQYGQQAVPPQQGAYGRPNGNHAGPESFSGAGGTPTGNRQQGIGGGRGRGPNTKGLLIGAVAVVAAVVIGIAVAMANGDSGDDNKAGDDVSSSPTVSQSASPSASSSGDAEDEVELPEVDAKALRLGGAAALASDVQGAQADGGIYVALNQVGNSVTWSVDGIPEDGAYTLFAHYSTAGDDQSMTLTVNGKKFGQPLSMKNYAKAADGDFAKGWTTTFAWPTLTKGTNTVSLSCEAGDKCNVLLDQFWLKKGQVEE